MPTCRSDLVVGAVFFVTALAIASDVSAIVITDPSIARTQKIELGSGFDSVTGEVKESCLEGIAKPDFSRDPPKAGEVTYKGDIVENATEFAKSSSLTLSAAFGSGAFSAGASYRAIQSGRFSGRSTYAVIKAVSQTSPYAIAGEVRLKDKALGLLDAHDILGFRSLCGDGYVRDEVFGVEYDGIYSTSSQTDEEQQSVRKTFNAAINSLTSDGSLNGSASDQISSLISSGRTTFEHSYSGDMPSEVDSTTHQTLTQMYCPSGAPAKMPGTIQEMLQFGSTLSCRMHNAEHGLAWTVVSYGEVDSRAEFGESGTNLDVENLMKLYSRSSGLSYMLSASHQSEFGPFDAANARAEKGLLDATISVLKEEYTKAYAVHVGADADSRKSADIAAFERRLAHAASMTSDPPHRAYMCYPEITKQGPQKLCDDNFFRNDYKRAITQTGPYIMDGVGNQRCPTNCGIADRPEIFFKTTRGTQWGRQRINSEDIGTSIIVSLGQNPAQSDVEHNIPKEGLYGYYVPHGYWGEEEPPPHFSQNRWDQSNKIGIMVFEVFDPPPRSLLE